MSGEDERAESTGPEAEGGLGAGETAPRTLVRTGSCGTVF